jgi:hypothetical protein
MSLSQAVMDLYPEIGWEKSNFRKGSCEKQKERKKGEGK